MRSVTAERLFLIGLAVAVSGCVRERVDKDPGLIQPQFEIREQSQRGQGAAAGTRRKPQNATPKKRTGQETKEQNGPASTQSPKSRNQPEGPRAVFPVSGNIVSVNPELEFVVLEFLPSRMPSEGTEMSVFRNGKPIGKVRITKPRMNNLVTADLISGAAQQGDEVRKK